MLSEHGSLIIEMTTYTESIEKLINQLIKLPGIGRRSAERIVGYILSAPEQDIRTLSEAISKTKENVRLCAVCHNLSEEELCRICKDDRRDRHVVCIVEKPSDVLAIEKTGNFHGVYHVLLGSISPLDGKGPHDLKIDTLRTVASESYPWSSLLRMRHGRGDYGVVLDPVD